jgi:hypothetical protein
LIDTQFAEQYAGTHEPYVVAVALVNPSPDTHLLELVTTGSPDTALTDLAKNYSPAQLCVSSTHFSGNAIASVQKDPALQTGQNGIFASGSMSIGSNGELEFRLEALAETPTLHAEIAKYPPGLISLQTWLRQSN